MQKKQSCENHQVARHRNGLLRALYSRGGRSAVTDDILSAEASNLPLLIDCGLVRTEGSSSNNQQLIQLTSNGVRDLRGGLCVCHGDEDQVSHDPYHCADFNYDELQIESATESCRPTCCPLCFDNETALWNAHQLKIWGSHPRVPRPLLIGEADISIIEAEAAMALGGKDLDALLKTDARLQQHTSAFQGTDGRVVQHIYELAEMLEMQDSIGSNIIILNDMRMDPTLVGRRVGAKVLGRLMARYGKGGGLLIVPMRPYGAEEGTAEHADTMSRLTKSFIENGMAPHPYADGYVVGCIRKLSGLPG